MDQACFLSRSVSHVNCVNCVFYNKKLNPETVSFQILKLMNFLPKFYYELDEFAGDYYYTTLYKDIEQCK